MYVVSIDKQVINEMPLVNFTGRIHVIDAVSRVKSAVEALRTASVVGFDTETRPSFKRGERHKAALLQLSTDTDAFLFRLNKTGLPDPLKRFLEDESIVKVGLSTTDDFHQLDRMSEVHPGGFVELQQLVKQYEIADMSLQKIFAILFRQKISKGQQLSNWEAPQLTDAQQRYAAIDAWACLLIYQYLQSGSFIPKDSPYYHELVEDRT
jgi:ribonuclease D